MKNTVKEIINELVALETEIDYEPFELVITAILSADNVFISGAGRSGNIMENFAKRLMHAEIPVHVIGETTTPKVKKEDFIIFGTGSGETESLVAQAKKAKSVGAKIAVITTNSESTIGNMSDLILKIPASTPKSTEVANKSSKQPMANLFEQFMMIICDGISIELGNKIGMTNEEMFANHANIE